MKKTKLSGILLSFLLVFSLLLSSCLSSVPPDGPTTDGDTSQNTPDTGDTGDTGSDTVGDGDGGKGDEVIPPVVVTPTLPDFGEEEDEDFGEYTTYYLFESTDGDGFVLTAVQSNAQGQIRTVALRGTATVTDDKNYTLSYENGEIGYGKIRDGVFYLTDKSFAAPEDGTSRGGDGVTEIGIETALGSTDYGYRDLAWEKNGDALQSFYRDMLDACKAFALSTENVPNTSDYYKICELNFADHGIDAEQAQTVWSLFRMENPVFYWLSSVCYYTPTTFYLTVDEEYALYESRYAFDCDIDEMIASCAELMDENMSDVARALAVHDFLLARMDYAYVPGTTSPEVAVFAHNITGAASYGAGVCEAYAKAYQLLAICFDVPTLFVTGDAGERHAWNLSYLSGEWVGIDVTWDDMGEGAYITTNFGLSASALASEHTQDPTGGTGASYHYQTPPISPLGLSLLYLYEDETELGLFGGLDDAFGQMSNPEAVYTVKFYNYTEHAAYNIAAPDVRYYTSISELPLCAAIVIGGEYHSSSVPVMANVYLTGASLEVSTPLELQNLCLTEAHGSHKGVTLNENLTFGGELAALTLSFVGEGEDKSITVTSGAELVLNTKLRVNTLFSTAPVTLGAQSEITSLTAPSLTVDTDGATVLIHGLTMSSSPASLELYGTTLYTKLLSCADTLKATVGASGAELHLSGTLDVAVELFIDGESDAHLDADTLLFLSCADAVPSLRVYTADSGRYLDRTDFFVLSEEYALVRKTLTVTEQMISSGDMLLSYFGTEGTLTLPDGITRIGADAFSEASLGSLTLPEGILHLCRGALHKGSFTSVTLPASLCTYDTTVDDYTVLSPVGTYTFLGTYAEWARVAALSDFVLYYYGTPPTFTCSDGSPLLYNVISQTEGKPYRAVSGVLRDITSTTKVGGKRMHLIDYDADGNATLMIYDVYESGSYGQPSVLGNVTLTELSEGIYSFTLGSKSYYIRISSDGIFEYTDISGNAVSTYPQ